VANIAVELNVGPVSLDLGIEGFELGNSLVLIDYISLLRFDRLDRLVVGSPPRLQSLLQLDDPSGPKVGENAMASDGFS